MIAPKRLHPFKRRVPGMDGVVHTAIHKIAQNKTGKEHERIAPGNKIYDREYNRRYNNAWQRGHK